MGLHPGPGRTDPSQKEITPLVPPTHQVGGTNATWWRPGKSARAATARPASGRTRGVPGNVFQPRAHTCTAKAHTPLRSLFPHTCGHRDPADRLHTPRQPTTRRHVTSDPPADVHSLVKPVWRRALWLGATLSGWRSQPVFEAQFNSDLWLRLPIANHAIAPMKGAITMIKTHMAFGVASSFALATPTSAVTQRASTIRAKIEPTMPTASTAFPPGLMGIDLRNWHSISYSWSKLRYCSRSLASKPSILPGSLGKPKQNRHCTEPATH